jgi:predicted phage terminase large subunit-like protein
VKSQVKLQEALQATTREDLIEGWARAEHLAFMQYCWQKQGVEPFLVGPHTTAFCTAIDVAMRKLKQGMSSYILGMVCFGHGKSEIVSNYLPAHFVGEFPDAEVIVTSHTADKVSEFSSFGQRLIDSPEYDTLYPKIGLDERNVSRWSLCKPYFGKVHFAGIDGPITGKRGALIVVDDFVKNRQEAESDNEREKGWQAFTNNIMSRRAAACIVFVLCTPWHKDDISGRIQEKMKQDKSWPQFSVIKFPAESDKYPDGYLFPAKYNAQWYIDSKMFLGTYGTASLMQCEPQLREGGMFRTDKIHYYDDMTEVEQALGCSLQMKRAWDLASTLKQTTKDNPDFTVGIKGSVTFKPSSIPNVNFATIIIDDVIRGQWEAPKRDPIIQNAAVADGVQVGMEAFGAYKDAYTTAKAVLSGIVSVEPMQLPGDKKAKADPMSPVFEAGNVWMRRAPWNGALIDELNNGIGGAHDDQIDALACMYHMFKANIIQIF